MYRGCWVSNLVFRSTCNLAFALFNLSRTIRSAFSFGKPLAIIASTSSGLGVSIPSLNFSIIWIFDIAIRPFSHYTIFEIMQFLWYIVLIYYV